MDWHSVEPVSAAQTLTRSESPAYGHSDLAEQLGMDLGINVDGQPSELAGGNVKSLTIGLIDRYLLTQECLAKALGSLRPEIEISCFTALQNCIDAASSKFDLIIYYVHGYDALDPGMKQAITTITGAFPTTPVMIFSDADRAQHQTMIRSTLESGARGFVPTQTAGVSLIWAAINLVNAGGTFVPADLMLTVNRDHAPVRRSQLTSRQSAVFTQLRLGKANKIIAYELGMCESTVKVHVRNIMRKLGATNRTQAAYKGLRFSNEVEGA
ncbi:response regulator transcription factor, partial [Acidisphaera sp. S103]|uniref:response regulator transcription factor n=1 Tax=Acidisphaera sp. S103 TaxID=1747223 RepID=UPI00131EAE31